MWSRTVQLGFLSVLLGQVCSDSVLRQSHMNLTLELAFYQNNDHATYQSKQEFSQVRRCSDPIYCGSAVNSHRNTMRKNLPKTLDQLIFCKYTLNVPKFTKHLVEVHKFTKYLVNSYHQKDVKHYVLTNWYQMTII